VAGPETEPDAEPVVIGSWTPAGPVELVQTPLPATRAAETAQPAASVQTTAGFIAVTSPLAFLPVLPIAISTISLGSPGARAAPPERDEGHEEVTSEANAPPEPEAIDPFTPFDVHGPGAVGGSGGGSPGTFDSFRYAAVAPAPVAFAFPSAFADSAVPSSVPDGTLEDAPTTRPG
jgi:hypothetical protein